MPVGIPGVIIAVVLFAIGIGVGAVFAYLLVLGRRPKPHYVPAGREGRILLPFTGEVVPAQALEVAINLSRERDSKLILFYIAIVPVTLNIEAELAREVDKGFTALESAERTAKAAGVDAEIRLERERTVKRGIMEMLNREPFDSLVVEMEGAGPGLKLERQVEVVEYLFQKVKKEIIIVRSSREAAAVSRGE